MEEKNPGEKLASVIVWLLDTGPIVAYLDEGDAYHEEAARTLEPFRGKLITTSAVIIEAMHFVAHASDGPAVLADFIFAGRVTIFDCCGPEELKAAILLMKKYADTPMDFADASLIVLGAKLQQSKICTLDRRGFSTYRTIEGKRFELVMEF